MDPTDESRKYKEKKREAIDRFFDRLRNQTVVYFYILSLNFDIFLYMYGYGRLNFSGLSYTPSHFGVISYTVIESSTFKFINIFYEKKNLPPSKLIYAFVPTYFICLGE